MLNLRIAMKQSAGAKKAVFWKKGRRSVSPELLARHAPRETDKQQKKFNEKNIKKCNSRTGEAMLTVPVCGDSARLLATSTSSSDLIRINSIVAETLCGDKTADLGRLPTANALFFTENH
jgi:hypothetical protein